MRTWVLSIFLIIGGLVTGGLSALWAAGLLGSNSGTSPHMVRVGPWTSDWSIGSRQADAYVRARVAVIGLFALTRDHSVYFIRNTDDSGDRLDPACSYQLSGGQYPARWWSVTLYADDNYLPRNDGAALSFDATRAEGRPWSVTVSPDRPVTGSWISTEGAGAFDITLRLYGPRDQVLNTPETLVLPNLAKVSCPGNGA